MPQFNFSNISLSAGGGRKGTPYTSGEKTLAVQILTIAAVALGRVPEKDLNVGDDVVEGFTAAHAVIAESTPNDIPLGAVARKAFTAIAADRLETDPDNFPKKRDYISLNLIFRKASQKVNFFTQEEIDILFRSPSSYGKKNAG